MTALGRTPDHVAWCARLAWPPGSIPETLDDRPFVGIRLENRAEFGDGKNLFDRIANRESALLEDESDVGGYPELSNEVGAADTDRDGLPNDWEKIHGSDPTRMDSGLDSDGDGYTLLDDYLDEVIADAR